MGISKINSEFISLFVKRMENMIDETKHDKWWEDVLYSFTDGDEHQIHTKDVDGLFWSEIDYFDDYERILNYLETQKEKEA